MFSLLLLPGWASSGVWDTTRAGFLHLTVFPALNFLPLPPSSGFRGQAAPPPRIMGSTPSPGPPRLSPWVPAFGLKQVVGGSVEFEVEKSFHVLRGGGRVPSSAWTLLGKGEGGQACRGLPSLLYKIKQDSPTAFQLPDLMLTLVSPSFKASVRFLWGPPLPLPVSRWCRRCGSSPPPWLPRIPSL